MDSISCELSAAFLARLAKLFYLRWDDERAVAAGKQKRKAGPTAVVELVPEAEAPDGEQAALAAKNAALAAENAALRRKVAELERLTEVEVTDVETGIVAVHHQTPAEAERRLKRAGEALSAAGARVQRVKLERGAAEAAAARAVSEAEYEAETYGAISAF